MQRYFGPGPVQGHYFALKLYRGWADLLDIGRRINRTPEPDPITLLSAAATDLAQNFWPDSIDGFKNIDKCSAMALYYF